MLHSVRGASMGLDSHMKTLAVPLSDFGAVLRCPLPWQQDLLKIYAACHHMSSTKERWTWTATPCRLYLDFVLFASSISHRRAQFLKAHAIPSPQSTGTPCKALPSMARVLSSQDISISHTSTRFKGMSITISKNRCTVQFLTVTATSIIIAGFQGLLITFHCVRTCASWTCWWRRHCSRRHILNDTWETIKH